MNDKEVLWLVEQTITKYENTKQYHHEEMKRFRDVNHPDFMVSFASRERCSDFIGDLERIKLLIGEVK